MPYLILSVLLLLVFGANAYFYVRLFQMFPFAPSWCRWSVGVLLFLCSVSFIVAMLLRHSGAPVWLMHGLFRFGSVWMLFLLYMVPALLFTDVLHVWCPSCRHTFPLAVLLDVAVLVYGYWHHSHPCVNRVELPSALKTPGAPRRIVFISDVHLGEGTGRGRLARYVDRLNALKPDVLLIGGDLVDSSVHPLWRDNMAGELGRLHAPMGVYMVPGNHDHYSDIRQVRRFLEQTPITLLCDSVVTLPGGIRLVGRDDRMNRRRSPLRTLTEGFGKDEPVIVMDHQPYDVCMAGKLGADLLLCGHTHRGQVWPINWLTDFLFEQSHGYRKWPHGYVYVSQGLSLWGPPFRIGSESEIVVFE